MQRPRGGIARRGKRMKLIPGEAVRDWFNSQPREPWENRIVRDILIRFRNRLRNKPRQWGSPISDRRYPVGHLQSAKEAVENKTIPLRTGQPDTQELKKLSPILKQLSEWRAVQELQGKQKSYPVSLGPGSGGGAWQGHITLDFGEIRKDSPDEEAYLPDRVEIHTEGGDLMDYPVSQRLELFDSILKTLEPPEEKEPTLGWEASTVRVPRDYEAQKLGRSKAVQKHLTEYVETLPRNMQERFQGGTLTISLGLTEEEAEIDHAIRVLMGRKYLNTLEESERLDTTLPAINDPRVLKSRSEDENERWKERVELVLTPEELSRACGLEAKDRGRGYSQYSQGEVYRKLQALDKWSQRQFAWKIDSRDGRDYLTGVATPCTKINWYRRGKPEPGEFADDLTPGKLQRIIIYPSSIFLYRLNENFDILPANLYSEIKRVSGGKPSKYAGRIIRYLFKRATDIYRAGRSKGIEDPYTDPAWADQWTLKISKWGGDRSLAKLFLMDSNIAKRNWKRIDDILKECFRIAGEIRTPILKSWVTVKGKDRDLVALTLDPSVVRAVREGVDSGRSDQLIVRLE